MTRHEMFCLIEDMQMKLGRAQATSYEAAETLRLCMEDIAFEMLIIQDKLRDLGHGLVEEEAKEAKNGLENPGN